MWDMDLNSNHLVPESIEDNASSVHVDDSKIVNHGPSTTVLADENVSANGLVPDGNHDEGVRSPEQVNVEVVGANSPGGSSSSTKKGYGLKKWRRIKREEGLLKDGRANVDSSKVLKRGLSGSVNPPSKPVTTSSVEAKQWSGGSVGSVNMANSLGMANGFSPDPDSRFVIGQTSSAGVELENSEDHESKSSAVASVVKNLGGKIIPGSSSRHFQQGKSHIDAIKKARGDQINPCSSLDSDSRSTKSVFSNGVASVADNGKQSEGWRNLDGDCSYQGHENGQQFNEEVQNGYREENGDHETRGSTQNHHKDPLVESVRSLAAVQEALEKEVQELREIRRESIPLHHDVDELSSPNLLGTGESKGNSSKFAESLEQILKQNVKHLESELDETKTLLDSKDAKIQELEKLKIEYELEALFQRRIEAEIEHLMLTTSLKTFVVLEQQKRTQTSRKSETKTTEDLKHNRDISGKACKFGLCFVTQLILLIFVVRFSILQSSPDSQAVIPT